MGKSRRTGRIPMSRRQQTRDAGVAVTEELQGADDLLSRILTEGRLGRDELQAERARDMIGQFVQEVMQGQLVMGKDMEASILGRISEIDRLLTAQLNAIMHLEEYQKLEGSWRGLHHLVSESETGTMLKIKVMNVGKKELGKDLEKAIEFDQSALFKKIYEEEFGTFGGAPFGALIGDYEFSNHPQDMALLEKVSNVAAAAHAPFISAASPQLFGWDTFSDLVEVRDLAKIFDRTEYLKWRSFRESEDS